MFRPQTTGAKERASSPTEWCTIRDAMTGLIYDERFLLHDTGAGHPERAGRLKAIVQRLKEDGAWDKLLHIPAEPAELKWIHRLHDERYVARLRSACERGDAIIDTADCPICPRTYEIALLAAGGALAGVDAIMQGRVANAFCALRPPGHHAERSSAMGFCFFGNVALAADYTIARHDVQRVAIVDFDVHHGNGTQHLLEERSDVLFISLHEHPDYLYPGTGFAEETGIGEGEGFTINLPIVPPAGDAEYRRLFETRVIPALDEFKPQFIVVSAGFDAAMDDPLAHMEVTAEGFAWMTRALLAAAKRHAGGRLLSCLEGGYDLNNLAAGVSAHMRELMAAAK